MLRQILHPTVLGPLLRHPPRLIRCEICGGIRIQIYTFPAPEVGARCLFCRGTARHRSIFAVIRDIFGHQLERLRGGSVYEVSAHGAIHRAFRRLSPEIGFTTTFSELLECPPGESLNGVRCENLEHLTFPDSHFDLITSSDVMEHVENDIRAYREIARVLKPGGHVIFTVPFENRPTLIRARRNADGSIENLLPPEYHSDPWNPVGVFTWRSHGPDIVERMAEGGLQAEVRTVYVSGVLHVPIRVIVGHHG